MIMIWKIYKHFNNRHSQYKNLFLKELRKIDRSVNLRLNNNKNKKLKHKPRFVSTVGSDIQNVNKIREMWSQLNSKLHENSTAI